MIPVTFLSRSFSSFWMSATPWLNNYVSFVNRGQLERFDTSVSYHDEPEFRAINNTVAFYLFLESYRRGGAIPKDITSAFNQAKAALQFLPRNNLETYSMGDNDSKQIIGQTKRLLMCYRQKDILAHPEFPGCGIILSTKGDIVYDHTLVEIKAGERNLIPSDIRQLLIYLALNFAGGNVFDLNQVEILNPRQGLRYSQEIEDLCRNISDKTSEELFSEIIVTFSEVFPISV